MLVVACTLLLPGTGLADDSGDADAPREGDRAGNGDDPAAVEESTEESVDESDRADPVIDDETTVAARNAFLEGAALVRKARWAEALQAFEKSAALKPHAVTTYNVGACLRAMGRYVLAKRAFERALAQDAAPDAQLSATLRNDTEAFIGELDRIVARARIRLDTRGATIAVDGRPLLRSGETKPPVLLAGVRPAGKGEAPPAKVFTVVMDPGAHVFTLTKTGFKDAVVNRTVQSGESIELDLTLEKLPAQLSIRASEDRAVVTVDGRDVGHAPVRLSRREGDYKVAVVKEGFVPYETTVSLDPGEQVNLRADLAEEPPAVYEQWWFWGALGAAATSIALTTYFVTRPEPTAPPADGGGLNWIIDVP